jgi:hypothetical protein
MAVCKSLPRLTTDEQLADIPTALVDQVRGKKGRQSPSRRSNRLPTDRSRKNEFRDL